MDKVGRDLRKTIIIDNLRENFRLHPTNGIHVCDFIDDFTDDTLDVLRRFLTKLAEQKVADVRPVLQEYEGRYEQF